MFCYRITKYNPEYRDSRGAYLRDEWTSYSDIGKKFQGIIFDYDTYLKTESTYINAIITFMECLHLDKLCINKQDSYRNDSNIAYISKYFSDTTVLRDGACFDKTAITNISRLVLREQFWCKLEADSMYVHFGWDYYMYIGSNKKCSSAVTTIKKTGLFVETFVSPYSDEDK
ncbi:MAG TPA: hypothetical protein VGW78_01645 [Candidatus Babeliales bacterium]|jgi:hypothetical protein|nr:hypothetical protein [Candidatus Babeliales bacterium]